MKFSPFLKQAIGAGALFALALTAAEPASAGPGHDHGEEAAPPAAAGPSLPRFETSSDRFEIVGRIEGEQLRLWVDDWATTAPVTRATLEITLGARKLAVMARPDGTYVALFPDHDTPGTYPLAIAIRGAGAPALLGASLVIDEEHLHESETGVPLALLLGGGALLLIAAGGGLWLLRRRRAAALTALALLASGSILTTGVPEPARAGPGHDHGEEAAAPAGASPDQAVRLADGDLAAPKPMQRLIGLRTMVTRGSAEAGALALTGVVIADPNGLGVVQPSTAGRISGRLPALGERVSAGQLLAVITPALDADVSLTTARGAAESALAEAQLAAGPGGLAAEAAELAQAESRLTRLVGLEGVVPDRAIAEARTEVVAARARLSLARSQAAARLSTARSEAARLRRAGSGAETLRAPVSGVISTVAAAQGQVVSPGETVFTIVNPARLLVEARAPAGAVAVVAQAASGRTADGRSLTLARQGEGLSMVDGAAPLRFRVTQSDPLRVGEPVTVFAARGQTAPGIAIPRDAVTRGANGQAVVFVKQSAERFAATSVTVVDLDATRVLVTNGLSPGARVATTGAALLAQVR